ncbi:hypothetical protein Pelo_5342 [Pelomyxa schiedti]|nr:hypothetical protein Pelo_5342 [Pelomyxa schiedti]
MAGVVQLGEDFTPQLYRVLFEYASDGPNVLHIKPDDLIILHCKVDDEWWQGDLNGKVGFFPAAFVEALEARPANVLFSFTEPGDGRLLLEEGTVVNVLDWSSPDWWLVSHKKSVGFFPKNYLQFIDGSEGVPGTPPADSSNYPDNAVDSATPPPPLPGTKDETLPPLPPPDQLPLDLIPPPAAEIPVKVAPTPPVTSLAPPPSSTNATPSTLMEPEHCATPIQPPAPTSIDPPPPVDDIAAPSIPPPQSPLMPPSEPQRIGATTQRTSAQSLLTTPMPTAEQPQRIAASTQRPSAGVSPSIIMSTVAAAILATATTPLDTQSSDPAWKALMTQFIKATTTQIQDIDTEAKAARTAEISWRTKYNSVLETTKSANLPKKPKKGKEKSIDWHVHFQEVEKTFRERDTAQKNRIDTLNASLQKANLDLQQQYEKIMQLERTHEQERLNSTRKSDIPVKEKEILEQCATKAKEVSSLLTENPTLSRLQTLQDKLSLLAQHNQQALQQLRANSKNLVTLCGYSKERESQLREKIEQEKAKLTGVH